jgi:hypothetical protein
MTVLSWGDLDAYRVASETRWCFLEDALLKENEV